MQTRVDRVASLVKQWDAHLSLTRYLMERGAADDAYKTARQLFRSSRRLALALHEPFYYEPRLHTTLRNRRSGKLFRVEMIEVFSDNRMLYHLRFTGDHEREPLVSLQRVTLDELYDRFRLMEDYE